MKYTYVFFACYVGTLYCMEKENLLPCTTIQAGSPLKIAQDIENTKADYAELPHVEICCGCYTNKATKYKDTLSELNGQKKKAKKENSSYFVSIKDLINTNAKSSDTETHTININNDHILLKDFYKNCAYLQNLTELKINKTKLAWLPLHDIVKYCPNLTDVDVSGNIIEGIGYHSQYAPYHIRQGISKHSVKTLNVSDNQLKDFNIDKLWELCPYTDLDLSLNRLVSITCNNATPCKTTDQCSKLLDNTWRTCSLPTVKINTQLPAEEKKKLIEAHVKGMQRIHTRDGAIKGLTFLGMPISILLSLFIYIPANVSPSIEFFAFIAGLLTYSTIVGTAAHSAEAYTTHKEQIIERAREYIKEITEPTKKIEEV